MTDMSRPLAGIRVVCIAIYVPALVAAAILFGVSMVRPKRPDAAVA